jgi:L-Ala-D/L-Glu epimerase
LKITRLTFAADELPLVSPLQSARGTMTSRHVILVALRNAAGQVGLGEAAPLPSHGTESFDDACDMLARAAMKVDYPELAPDSNAFAHWLRALGLARDFAPACCWALECALASLAAQEQGCTLAQWLGAKPTDIRVNALIGGGDAEEILRAAKQAITDGFRALKLKVGVRPIREEIEIVRRLRTAFPEVTLRLDANGKFSLDEARQFAHAITSSEIEYIEDPLADSTPENLRLLRAAAPVPIALDEPLAQPEFLEEVLKSDFCNVLVMKPAVVGSWSRLKEITEAARMQNLSLVISNLVESSVGLNYAAHAAAAFGDPERAHGLGTAVLLARDTVSSRMIPRQGNITFVDPKELLSRLTRELASSLQLSGT